MKTHSSPALIRALVIISGAFVLLIVCVLFLWHVRHTYYEAKKSEAMRFCEALAPLIEESKQKNGRYPQGIDPAWLGGRPNAQLVQPNELYSSHHDVYNLRFRNPGDFWNDIWDYQCGGPKGECVWLNYD